MFREIHEIKTNEKLNKELGYLKIKPEDKGLENMTVAETMELLNEFWRNEIEKESQKMMGV